MAVRVPAPATRPFEALVEGLRDALALHASGWPTDDGVLTELEAVRQTLRLAGAGVLGFLESDPAYPMLLKLQSPIRQFQLPAADAVYHFARLHGDHVYRLHGDRGTASTFQLSVARGSGCDLSDYEVVVTQDHLEHPALAGGATVDLVLSRERRAGHWLPLPDGECELFIRQYYGDWDTERPANLTIEREGAPFPPPPPRPETLERGLGMVARWLRAQSAYYRRAVEFHLDADPGHVPELPLPEAFQDNRYLCGHFRCARDEAVVLSVRRPAAVYWGFQLANLQWEAMDFHMRQTSLNFHQATIDDDGVFRAVIAHDDPGVANWLDPAGHTVGLIAGRYYKSADVPVPTLTKVALADLAAHLPPETRAVDAGERQAALRARLASIYRRGIADQ